MAMSAGELLVLAWEVALDTARYLFVYAYVLLLAPAGHLGLVALTVRRRRGAGEENPLGWLRAGLAGLGSPLSRSAVESTLRRARSTSAAVVFLAVAHLLTASYWILLGPLLGKDFLLSHLIGAGLFVLIAALLAQALGVGRPSGAGDALESAGPAAGGRAALLGGAAARYVLLLALGLALGGIVAAWGLSPWAWASAEVAGTQVGRQLLNGLLGLAVALTGIPQVANLFVGTYLWKVGLAHAGIVAFFCAATASPALWPLYARLFGRGGAVRLVASLLLAAFLAGLATAWIFGATELTIRYRLIPEQLWEVP
jgi:hypothetical protein